MIFKYIRVGKKEQVIEYSSNDTQEDKLKVADFKQNTSKQSRIDRFLLSKLN